LLVIVWIEIGRGDKTNLSKAALITVAVRCDLA
jgi:hypothetical protein